MPQSLPSLEWLEDVAVHLQHEEQLWVSACRRDTWAKTKAFMDDDWRCGGKIHAAQIRPPPSKPLNSLVQELPLNVGRLRHQKGQRAKFRCRPDEQPLPGDVWKFGDISCKVVSVQGNDVSLDRPLSCKMCKNVPKLLRWNADPKFVAAEVQAFWHGFWNTESPPDLHFLTECCNDMAQLPKFSAEITLPELEVALKTLTTGKARGMDGFSNGELKLLSPELKARLLTLLNLVTETGCWPESQLKAYVSLLGKVPEPTTPADARPITVLGTLYRVWAKIMAKKMIHHMMPWLPKTLHGSIPRRSAEDLAVDIQTCIEDAVLQSKFLAGCSLDLSKAYNTISRPLIWLLAEKAGWPVSVQHAYKGFLDGVTRFFQVGGSLLSPTTSKVGVPEGCPVAVVAMILVTALVSHRTQTRHDVPMRSFVDNWSLQHAEASKVVAATEEVAMVTQKCGMILSLDKSLMYATTKQARQFLKKCKIGGQQVPTKNSFQDLGVVFTSRHQASSLNLSRRFSKHKCRFDKLRLRKCAPNRKAKALSRVVLPAVLYGAATASASASFLRNVRAAANAAVWGHSSNRDHFMTPLVSAAEIYEPFLHIFKQRWSVLRRLWMAGCASVHAVWGQLSAGVGVGCGPVSYFVQQLRRIGWDILPDGKVKTDAGLILELITTPWRDVRSFALDAWTNVTAVRARSGMALPVVSIPLVRSGLKSKDGYNSWLAGYCVGAMFSSAQRAKFLDAKTAACPHCEANLDAEHLLLCCPATESMREELGLCNLSLYQKSVVKWGMYDLPSEVQELRSAIFALKWQNLECVCPKTDAHIFTDGSASDPKAPLLSLASWAVLEAQPDSLTNRPVITGVTPGTQCISRAELCALLAAVQCVSGGTLYVDSQNTVDGFQQLLALGWSDFARTNRANLDLWLCVAAVGTLRNWDVVKVKSHQEVAACTSDFEAWCVFHNNAVDKLAKRTNLERDSSFRALRNAAERALSSHRQFLSKVHQLQTHAATLCRECRSKPSSQVPLDCWQYSSQHLKSLQVRIATALWPSTLPSWESFLFCKEFGQVLLSWLHNSNTWVYDPLGCSLVELYVAFLYDTGWLVPINVAGWKRSPLPDGTEMAPAVWVHEAHFPSLMLARQSLQQQVRTFATALRQLAHMCGVQLQFAQLPSLRALNVQYAVQSISVRPRRSLDSSFLCTARRVMGGRSLRKFAQLPFAPMRSVNISTPYVVPNFVALWLAHRRAHRQARDG